MPIQFKKLENFKGLMQNVDDAELPLNYCHELKNIDTFDPLGQMRVRKGYAKKYSTLFTDLRSAYEYYYKEADETKLFINDNGSIKISTDGGAFGSAETLPTGATIETSFKCHWMGYKNHVLMTTGSGDTNYILGYYYVNRVAADNTGLFGNQQENTGYLWDKAQLISPNGTFNANIYNVVYYDSFYYISFNNSRYIEKRNSDFHLVSRFVSHYDASNNSKVALDVNATAGKIYMGTENGLYQVDPDTWEIEKSLETANYTNTLGICNDGTHIYSIKSDRITQTLISNFTFVKNTTGAVTTVTSGVDIACDATANTGMIFSIENNIIYRRDKNDANMEDTHSNSNYSASNLSHIVDINDVSAHVLVSSIVTNHVYKLNQSDVTLGTDYSGFSLPQAFVKVGGLDSATRIHAYASGFLLNYTTGVPVLPTIFGVSVVPVALASALDAGTYFYKVSIVDTDDQEYTLSDHIVLHATTGNFRGQLFFTYNDTLSLNQAYRISHFNIYRAYNTDVDAGEPGTDYKFLVKIDINDAGWRVEDGSYYFFSNPKNEGKAFYDNITETEISDVTYFENSGIGDLVKPRYVNGKYMIWIDNQLHLANFSHDGDTYPNRIIRSPRNQPDNIALYDYYDFDVSEGDEIKGITNIAGRSFVMKERKSATFYDGIPEREIIGGIQSDHAYFVKDDIVYFANEKGIFLFDGSNTVNITPSVQTYYKLGTEFDKIAITYIDEKDILLFSFHTTNTAVRRTIVLHLPSKTWNYYTNYSFRQFLKNNDGNYIAIRNDYICEIFSTYTKDLEDVGGGNGTAIPVYYISPMLKFSEIDGKNKMLLAYYIRFALNNAVPVYLYKFKDASTTLIDTFTPAVSASTDLETVVHYLQSEWGEAYRIIINGTVPNDVATESSLFKLSSITFKFKDMGMI